MAFGSLETTAEYYRAIFPAVKLDDFGFDSASLMYNSFNMTLMQIKKGGTSK